MRYTTSSDTEHIVEPQGLRKKGGAEGRKGAGKEGKIRKTEEEYPLQDNHKKSHTRTQQYTHTRRDQQKRKRERSLNN
jgi:hypothetical protein